MCKRSESFNLSENNFVVLKSKFRVTNFQNESFGKF